MSKIVVSLSSNSVDKAINSTMTLLAIMVPVVVVVVVTAVVGGTPWTRNTCLVFLGFL